MDNTVQFPHMALTKDAAKQFCIPASYLRKLCREGKVRFVMISKNKWLINLDSLAAYFNEGDNCPAEQPEVVAGIRRVAP